MHRAIIGSSSPNKKYSREGVFFKGFLFIYLFLIYFAIELTRE